MCGRGWRRSSLKRKSEGRVFEVEKDCNNVDVVMYGRSVADILRRHVLLATGHECMSSHACGKELKVINRNHLM